MFIFLTVITWIAFVVSAVLCATKHRVYVLIFFAVLSTITPIIEGYYLTTNFLGVGKQWGFLDVMFICLILIAWRTAPRQNRRQSNNRFYFAMWIIVGLTAIGLIVGLSRPEARGVLNYSRRFLFAPIFFVAARILTDVTSVEKLCNVIKWFVIPFFLIHVGIAFNIYHPPLAQETLDRVALEGVDFYRVDYLMAPILYIMAACITLSNIMYDRPKKISNWFVLVVSVSGVLLTQTRSYYFAMGLVPLLAFILLRRGKGKLIIYGVAVTVAVAVLIMMSNINIFFRFTTSHEHVNLSYWETWRGAEYDILANVYKKDYAYILTGRGLGALHAVPFTRFGYVNFFHNGYLQTLDSLGIIGLVCYFILMGSCVLSNRAYMRDPAVGHILVLPRIMLLYMALGIGTADVVFYGHCLQWPNHRRFCL